MTARRVCWRDVGIMAVVVSTSPACAPRATTAVSVAPRTPVVTVAIEPASTAIVNPPGTPPASGMLRTLHALQYVDVRVGNGTPLEPRQCVYAHYTGWLPDGTKFDSSRDTSPNGAPRQPISFQQGARRVIAGWDAGFDGMREGGQRRLIIPFPLAYGEAGRPPVIPERATLVFDVELLAARDTLPRDPDEPAMPGSPARCATWDDVAPTLVVPSPPAPASRTSASRTSASPAPALSAR